MAAPDNSAQVQPMPVSNQDARIDSKALFGSYKELIILHNNEEYRLRLTRNKKLLLTK